MNHLRYIIIPILFFVGCSTQKVVVNEHYTPNDLLNKTLLILPIPQDSITVLNKDDVEDDFAQDKRTPEAIIHDSTFTVMTRVARKFVVGMSVIDSSTEQKALSLFSSTTSSILVTKEIKDDTIPCVFQIPKIDSTNSKAQNLPDVILYINKITLGRNLLPDQFYFPQQTYIPGNTVTTPGGTFTTPGHFMPTGGGQSEHLGSNSRFILWDCKRNDAIAYGKINVKTPFIFGMTTSTWRDHFRVIIRTILQSSHILLKNLEQ